MQVENLIHQCRDKGRQALHKFSLWLGETSGVKPHSVSDQAKANASLTMDLPAFSSLLPYQSVDEQGFFINKKSLGFGFHLAPQAGADEALFKSLAEMFKNKLTEGSDCTFMLYKHGYLARAFSQSYAPILAKGGICAELAKLSMDYHLKALHKGYENGRNIPAQLADYSAYFFISRKNHPSSLRELKHLRLDFESELKVAGFAFSALGKEDLQVLLRSLVSPNTKDLDWPEIEDSRALLGENIAQASSVYEVSESCLDISLTDKEGLKHSTRVISCELSHYPKAPFALWQTADLFANILKPEQGISCPFLISFTIRGVNQEKVKARIKQRTKSLAANNNGVQNLLNPGLADEATEWRAVHEEMTKGDLHLLPTFYNLILFTSEEKEREHVAKAISAYRALGFTLMQSRCKQWLRFLASLPFMLTEGLFSSLQLLGMTRNLSHCNIANLLPVVADFKGCKEGLLLPTYRHQAFFFDPFDDRNLPISNYNRLTVASSGSGKSYLQQALLLDGFSRGHQIFVIDLGDSYKHLCQMIGGTYIDATTIALNPFTLFDFDGVAEIAGEKVNNYIQIRDLMAIMASPDQGLDEIQKDWLLDAILMAWQAQGQKTCIDDVLSALRDILQKPEAKNDRRLKDLLVLLSKYGREGIYGAMFNGETPLLNGSKFTVIELGGFESNPQLLTIVMFVMIVIIQGQFYHSDRQLKKQCNFDEMWRAFSSNSNPIAANFLEQGYRTARKYNAGFSAVTQKNSDTDSLQGQAIVACSDTKFIMRQGDLQAYTQKNPDRFNALQKKVLESFGEAKMQGFSNLMIEYGSMYTFHRYFSDPFSRVLFSTSGDEFGEIEALMAEGNSLKEAITAVAEKYYGEKICD